jgi:hypothetical protein
MVKAELVSLEQVEKAIVLLRGHKAMLDSDLAVLYGVSTKALNQAVARNRQRFPPDFMFQLTIEEAERSRSQFVTLNAEVTEITRLQGRPGAIRQGTNIKYLPYAFTEQGVAMLSSVLRSPRAVQVNIEIMRAFVQLRRMLQGNSELARKLEELEARHDAQFSVVFDAIRKLMAPAESPKKRIGFEKDSG